MTENDATTAVETTAVTSARSWSTRTLVAAAVAAVLLGVGAGATLGSLGADDSNGRGVPGQMRGNMPGQGQPGQGQPGGQRPSMPGQPDGSQDSGGGASGGSADSSAT